MRDDLAVTVPSMVFMKPFFYQMSRVQAQGLANIAAVFLIVEPQLLNNGENIKNKRRIDPKEDVFIQIFPRLGRSLLLVDVRIANES